jgi:hypothetical protein
MDRNNTKNNKVNAVGAGQEVVDSELAQAARAVVSLSDVDMSALLEKLKAGDMKELLSKLHEADKRQKKLEKQLAQSGIAIAEEYRVIGGQGQGGRSCETHESNWWQRVTAADKAEQAA